MTVVSSVQDQEIINLPCLTDEKNYLDKCQVDTPYDVIKNLWILLKNYRSSFDTVLDMGAGDGRFSLYGNFKKYTGIEIDPKRFLIHNLPQNATILNTCAFDLEDSHFDLCIGNPPYIKHHDIEDYWQEKNAKKLSKLLNVNFDLRSNAYLYFLSQALLRTTAKGLVALIIPFEWVTRPSAQPIRDYINQNGWGVHTFRFTDDIFPRVLTTASITIIDKASLKNEWNYYTINRNFEYSQMDGPTGNQQFLTHQRRKEEFYAQRGLSPGTQKVFCLTEGERLHYGLKIGIDVEACVTSLKNIPNDCKVLDENAFQKYFVSQGARCWLIKAYQTPSTRLADYLASVPFENRNTWTCNNRPIWWKFHSVKISKILYSSGFTNFAPKILRNKIKAIAVGSVHGIYYNLGPTDKLVQELRKIDFESQVVSHAGVLKKIEVNQMNTILSRLNNF